MTQLNPRLATSLAVIALMGLAGCSATPPPANTLAAATPEATQTNLIARGEYLTRIAGCNDCHTPGYAETGGEVPKAQWLLGSHLGWNGPWGTTYPVNIRLKLQEMDETGWMKFSGELHTRPPMPDFAVRAMTEDDRRAIYRFVRSLGPAGQKAPDYLPPGQTPQPPYVQWVLPSPPPATPAAS